MPHTPGPWDRIEHNPGADLLGMEGVMIVGTDDENVALTFDDAIGRANARLIAAAPDLLAACERAIPWLSAMISDGGHLGKVMPTDCVRTRDMMIRAVALATGH